MIDKAEHKAFADAIETGDLSAVESLVDKHPDIVNHPNWTPPPLHCAVLWNQPKIAEMLLDKGADIEMRDPDRQTTPLRYAIMFGKTDLIPLLLSRGANTGPIVSDGISAMQLAKDAANGAFEEYNDLPSRNAYESVVALLQQSGLSD